MDQLIFISAQPDIVYFHWQVQLYLHQFSKHGIQDQCYAVFGYTENGPSQYIVDLRKKYKHIYWYKDDRSDKSYIPSIVPHLLKKFFAEYPSLGRRVFHHDSDILFSHPPRFQHLLADDICYMSDTISYIGSEYILKCCRRYSAVYPDLPKDDLLVRMCEVAGISKYLVMKNNNHSGGAQYILKNVDEAFWSEVENMSIRMYKMLLEYQSRYPIKQHIQMWTAGMWALLWQCWKSGKQTRVHPSLDFSWATDKVEEYHRKPIFHLAGIDNYNCRNKFYKSRYLNLDVIEMYRRKPSMFNHVSPTSATYEYVNVIRDYCSTLPPINNQKISEIPDDAYEPYVGFSPPIQRMVDSMENIRFTTERYLERIKAIKSSRHGVLRSY